MALRLRDIRPGERRNTVGAFLVLFGTMTAHSLLETARDALFLAKIEAQRLPFVYLAIALLALAVSSAQQRDRRRTGPALFGTGLAIAAVITLVFWWLLGRTGDWILYALYVWSGLLSTLLLVRFWIVAADLFTVTQAKRLFAWIGTGSILGAIAGSALAARIVTLADAPSLLLAAATVLFATAFAPGILRRPDEEPTGSRVAEPAPGDVRAAFGNVCRHPYLRRVGDVVLISTVAFTIADFVFKSAVAEHVSATALGWVFATTYLALNVLSLVAQLALVGWITRNFGVDRMLSVLPALLLAGSAWLVAGGGVLAAFAIKGLDGTFRHSLHRTATEVLFVPLSRRQRERAKSFIDVVGQRGGQAIASVAFLALAAAGAPPPVLGALLVLLCAAWIAVAIGLKRHYFDLFRNTLREGISSPRWSGSVSCPRSFSTTRRRTSSRARWTCSTPRAGPITWQSPGSSTTIPIRKCACARSSRGRRRRRIPRSSRERWATIPRTCAPRLSSGRSRPRPRCIRARDRSSTRSFTWEPAAGAAPRRGLDVARRDPGSPGRPGGCPGHAPEPEDDIRSRPPPDARVAGIADGGARRSRRNWTGGPRPARGRPPG
jgi:AAA family ATP:ADP antiporter